MTTYESYVICTSPRSGSTLLCSLLAGTGVAGDPASYFHDRSVDEWAAELGMVPKDGASEREVLEAVFQAAIRKGRGGTDVFGLRLQAHSFGFFREKLATLYPGMRSDLARFQRAFGTTLFIHLTRPDKVAQAVSYLKADQSGLWHVAPDGTELERLAPHREPSYDRDTIRASVEEMTAHDAHWAAWFAREGIEPIRIAYDELSADPIGTLRSLLKCLGLDPAVAQGVEPGVKKLADRTNQEWVVRYRSDRASARKRWQGRTWLSAPGLASFSSGCTDRLRTNFPYPGSAFHPCPASCPASYTSDRPRRSRPRRR